MTRVLDEDIESDRSRGADPTCPDRLRWPVPRLCQLEAQRAKVPPDLVGEVVSGDVVQLAAERRHLTEVVIAYQAETDLGRRITPDHRADDETRTRIRSVRANAGDLAVADTELRVTFAPLSSPHRTGVLAALCTQWDASRRASQGPG